MELISFTTTYVGFKFFLGNVSPITPLFMSIVVQGGCYYLMNYTSSHKHSGSVKRNILLFMLIITSTLTSYMGIFNGILNPIEYIEKTYSEYQETSETLTNNYFDSQNYISFDQSVVNEYYNKYKNLIKHAENERDSIDDANITNTGDFQRNKYGGTDYVQNSDLVIKQSNNNQRIGNINKSIKELNDFMKDNSSQEVYKACVNILKNITLLNKDDSNDTIVYQKFLNSISDYCYLYKLIGDANEINKKDEDIISSLDLKKYKNSEDLKKELLLKSFDELINDNEGEMNKDEQNKNTAANNESNKNNKNDSNLIIAGKESENFIEQILGFLLPSTEADSESVRKKVNDTMKNNYDVLDSKLNDENGKDTLNEKYKKTRIPHIQFFPFVLPFRNTTTETLTTAMFSMIVAIIVDGFALMFSIALLSKRNSSLYYNNVDDFKQLREEIMEDCLMYNCLNELNGLEKVFDINEVNSVVAGNLNQMMNGFMKKVHQCYFPTSFNSYGYICDKDLENFNNCERNIFISLNNISMIKPFHRDELVTVLNHDFCKVDNDDVLSNKASAELIKKYNSLFKDNEVYYMVSKSVHVWFCDNFSELLENNIIFDKNFNNLLPKNNSSKENNHV